MMIWWMNEPPDSEYAQPGLRGAWNRGTGLCRECTGSSQRRVPPLIIEWEPGSDRIGDFNWPDCSPMITERVHRLLSERFRGYEIGPVEMVQDPTLKRPQKITKRTKPRVWLPYQGPVVHELCVTARVHMDAALTTAKLVRRCHRCGSERWELEGHEQWEHEVETQRRAGKITGYEDYMVHRPRVHGKGLHVRAADLGGADIFGVYEFPGWILCTDRVKEFIEEQQFTNVAFLEMGELIA